MRAPFDLESLKYLSEGDGLDFKRDQYKLTGPDATVGTKAEFIKDVLAMANSWAASERLLVVGVKAHRNGEKEIIGLTEHLDDADLQQLVNEKTNLPIDFHYSVHKMDGRDIGIVRIAPGQKRPFYLKERFGGLAARDVFVRRGSSTVVAMPEELAKMGAAPTFAPELSVWLAAEGNARTLSLIRYEDPPPPPPVPPEVQQMSAIYRALAIQVPTFPKYDFGPSKAELAAHKKECALLAEVVFVVRNEGNAALDDAKIRALVRSQPGLRVLEEMPDEPTSPVSVANLRGPLWQGPTTATVYETDEGWVIEAVVGKVRPKEAVASAEFVLGSDVPTVLNLEVQVFDAELRDGFRTTIEVPINVAHKVLYEAKDDTADEDEGDEA